MKMFYKIKEYGYYNIVSIIFLSLVITCMGKSLVKKIMDVCLPQETVIIEQIKKGDGIWILDDGEKENLFSSCKNGNQKGKWEYRDKDIYEYNFDVFYAYVRKKEVSLSFTVPISSSSYIMLWQTAGGGSIKITTENGDMQQIDLHSNAEGGEMIRVYPFKNRILPVIMCLMVYAILFLLVFIGLQASYCFLLWKTRGNGWINRESKKRYFFPIWFILYVIAIVQYKMGIPNFLQGAGDQIYYWDTVLFDAGKSWSPSVLAEELVSFRGYLCHFFSTVSKYISSFLNINPVYIYFIFTSMALAWLIVVVLPGLYKEFTSKNPQNFQMLLLLPIYLFFWNGTLTAVLADMFGMVAFFSGILFALQFKRKRCVWSAILAGFFFSVACNFRTAYQYALILMVIIDVFKQVFKCRGKSRCAKNKNIKTIYGVVAAMVAFIMIALPQFQINLEKGHLGLLPYDFNEAWDGNSLMEYSANYAIESSYAGFPVSVTDEQLLSLKKEQYNYPDSLSFAQILGVYANDPLNTLVAIAKKAFIAFDTKTSVTFPNYPGDIPWNSSRGFVFSFLNYFVLGSALYILFYQRKVTLSERIMAVVFCTGLVLPQMFVHVEWRYFLATYVLMYYLFSYHFVGEILASEKECQQLAKTKYLLFISVVIFASFVISLTLYAATFA